MQRRLNLPAGAGAAVDAGWHQQHSGTTEALRHVVLEPALALRVPLPAGTGCIRYGFWSADWTPWRALADLGARWPQLHFEVRPTYDVP